MIRRTQGPLVPTNPRPPQLPLLRSSKQTQRPKLRKQPPQQPPNVDARVVSLPAPQAEVDFVSPVSPALTSSTYCNTTT